jgi:ubiquinone/menaquinone biosynthesis C-methylase UbiE
MNQSTGERLPPFYAETYDASVPDWPGEIDFYRALAATVQPTGGSVLELACGTGRVALRLAEAGTRVVGIDMSPTMLEVARQKSVGRQNMHWIQGDMRSFDVGETFGLVIIPGHSFQNLLTASDQIACLACIQRHLTPSGTLVIHLDHQDVRWLGELCGGKRKVFEAAEQFLHPKTGRQIHTARAWSYERATQTAITQTVWEEIGADGEVVNRWETQPIRIHCVFRFEIEHLLARARFAIEAVYGDFFRQELGDESSEMIWVARRQQTDE